MTAPADDRMCRVVLMGMMGSGKTSVGQLLAETLRWKHYDNDAVLASLFGMTPKQLVDVRGEDAMRAAEDAALAHALAQPGPSIISAAGGTILSAVSRDALRNAVVVWLTGSPETLFARASGAAHRPWLDGGEAWVRAALDERQPLYQSVADAVIDTEDRPVVDIAAEIAERITELCRGSAEPRP